MSAFFDYPTGAAQSSHATGETISILADCSEREWAVLHSHCALERLRKGEPLVREGEADRSLYVVLSGAFGVQTPGGGTRAPMQPGEVIGEIAFFDGRPRSSSVVAIADSEVLHLSLPAFESLAAAEPALARRLLMDLGRALAGRLRAIEAAAR